MTFEKNFIFDCANLTRAQMQHEVKTHFFIVTVYLTSLAAYQSYILLSYFTAVDSIRMFQIQVCV